MYQNHFLRRPCPHHTTFTSLNQRLQETRSFPITRPNAGQERWVHTPELEDQVLQRFAESSSTSTRSIGAELSIRHETVWKILREEMMNPFHL
ncbi:uncharacterized protein TNIN_289641 [Trichonephila inaurata madagascariensis]|uniref:Uncharacterized protein n=1 Tax=Trichonephila inaurata madagascariensis TaxID=2747483 RepID=A0A8X6JRS6_9ARAC|nr:uncharacterized protein TNIN_289641 [Trichonephila inaurata madagascariensis]